MQTVTRNTNSNNQKMNLLEFFNGEIFVNVKNAKKLCGYSESSGNDVILDKVTEKGVMSKVTFAKNGSISETIYVSETGFHELLMNLTQKDKKQNAKLALEMIIEAKGIVNDFYLEKQGFFKDEEDLEIAEKIRRVMDVDGFKKEKWAKLYSKFSVVNSLSENIMKTAAREVGYCRLKYEMLDFIKCKYPEYMQSLHEIACKL